jgi:hypothetical protein
MGCTSVALLLLSLEERDLVEIGALQPSLGFKDFRRAARLHSLTNGQFGGEKQAGLWPPPRPQLQSGAILIEFNGIQMNTHYFCQKYFNIYTYI